MVQTISDSTVFSDSTSYSLASIAAANAIAGISPGNDEEYNEKEIDDIYLRYRQYGSSGLETDDSAFIAKLAWSCPYTDGEAVYKARSLYVIYNSPVYFDNSTLCGGGDETGSKERLPIRGEDKHYDNFRIFPNPSTGIVTINYPEAGRLEITNSMGQIVRIEILPAATYSVGINLENFTSGVYTYHFVSDDGTINKLGKITLLQ